uniref:SSD domain-containing protein n=1 Tax=Heterosigma akashiwo TaxID=2829 RepID=A0A7S3UNQ6_HETAK
MGVVESIIYVMVVGLSVDYTVHLSEAYLASGRATRQERTRAMVAAMGGSVLSGAFSTLGATTFLMMADIIFFTKFGSIIFFLICQSMVISLVGFTAMLDCFGPQVPQPGENIKRHIKVLALVPDPKDPTAPQQWLPAYVLETGKLSPSGAYLVQVDSSLQELECSAQQLKRRCETGSLEFFAAFGRRLWKGAKHWRAHEGPNGKYQALSRQNYELEQKIDRLQETMQKLLEVQGTRRAINGVEETNGNKTGYWQKMESVEVDDIGRSGLLKNLQPKKDGGEEKVLQEESKEAGLV